jgi:hypothetical protein
MTQSAIAGRKSAVQALRRLARPQPQVEQCEFCNCTLGHAHRHLLETATRRIACVCDPCALRFENVIGRWKLIPRDSIPLPDFQMSDGQWDGFALPINLAFFSTSAGRLTAMYPSPAGATESLLSLESWETLRTANPPLQQMQPDVQALLVNRLGDNREYYIAPIDRCFELVGIIRMHWRGFSGGPKVAQEIESFFKQLGSGARFQPREEEAVHA